MSGAGVLLGTVAIEGWLPPQKLSPNARIHHMERYRLVTHVYMVVGSALRQAAWPPQSLNDPRRRLTITLHRKRLMDPDNAVSLCKAVVDSVRASGALWDDSIRYLDLVVVQKIGPSKTVLELEEIEG